MPAKPTSSAHLGDWIEASGLHGQPSRRGEIVELLGHDAHGYYRVRWDEQHESDPLPSRRDHHHSAARPTRPPRKPLTAIPDDG
jgi:hypothetical protein